MVVSRNEVVREDDPFDVAFERFVARVSPRLVRAALLLTGDRGHAEDLAQTALLRVYRRWDSIGHSPDAYADEVLVNLARDRGRALRRRPREVELVDHSITEAVEGPSQMLERATLTSAVRRLPRRQREVVVLRFFLDLSVSQTATALGTSEGAVKAYAARALTRLRTLLEHDEVDLRTLAPIREVSDAH
jgi:RNA polymerase sigma-70 factor (sigma-E family)